MVLSGKHASRQRNQGRQQEGKDRQRQRDAKPAAHQLSDRYMICEARSQFAGNEACKPKNVAFGRRPIEPQL